MCGIAGMWGRLDPSRLARMAEALRHRGPDEGGTWLDRERGVGLVHRRLSVIDLEGGRQPIAGEDGRIVVAGNGEIYNHVELREELLARGHRFRTRSDTEVVVHLYEEDGPAFIERLRGMFALALWDGVREQLLLIRDRAGKKPLYYADRNGRFLFASEIKGIEAALDEPLSVDEQAVADYLAWGAIHAPATIYREIRSVRPAEVVVVRNARPAHAFRYWRLQPYPKRRLRREEAVETTDDLLRESVRLRLRSDVPVGCFLSGGIDSGLLTAVASELNPNRLLTVTVGFEDDRFDERPLARLVANRYDTDHHEVIVRPDPAEDLPRLARLYDQPYGNASAVPSYHVARAARAFVKVVLNGDGGDEVFAGYRRYAAARCVAALVPGESTALRSLWRAVSAAMPRPRGFRTPYAFLHRLLGGLSLPPPGRYLRWAVDSLPLEKLIALGSYNGNGDPSRSLSAPERLAAPIFDRDGRWGFVEATMTADFECVLPHDFLVKMDMATMAHGLEARSPFLDHVLVEEASRFPTSMKLYGLRTKPILRALAKRYLPPDICDAPKRGFEVPVVRWLRGELASLRDDALLSRDGLVASMIPRPALERLLRQGGGVSPSCWGRTVWHLLMLALWDRVVRRGKTECTSD